MRARLEPLLELATLAGIVVVVALFLAIGALANALTDRQAARPTFRGHEQSRP